MHMKVFFFFLTFLRFLTKYSMKLRIFGRNSADENYHRSLLIARRNVVLLLVYYFLKFQLLFFFLHLSSAVTTPSVHPLFDFPWPVVARITKISPKDKNLQATTFYEKRKKNARVRR